MDLNRKMSSKVNDKVTSEVFTSKSLQRGESLSVSNCPNQRAFAFCVIPLNQLRFRHIKHLKMTV